MFTFHICSKEFRRGDDIRRHVKTVHADDETIDDRDNLESIEEDDASDKADDIEPIIQDDSNDDVEFEEEEEEAEKDKEESSDDPWRLLIEEAFEQCQSLFDELITEHMARQGVDGEDARKRVYDNILPTYRKALVNVFVDEMLWFDAMNSTRRNCPNPKIVKPKNNNRIVWKRKQRPSRRR